MSLPVFRIWDKQTKAMLYKGDFELAFNNQKAIVFNLITSNNLEDFIIMQYTGLDDKCVQNIWGGDIVKYKKRYYYVNFEKGAYVLKTMIKHKVFGFLHDYNHEVMVIGHLFGDLPYHLKK